MKAYMTFTLFLLLGISNMLSAVVAVDCANIKGTKVTVGSTGNGMDEKVSNCPSGYSWEACCAQCGFYMQLQGRVSRGWYCERAGGYGIWLKGCNKATPASEKNYSPQNSDENKNRFPHLKR